MRLAFIVVILVFAVGSASNAPEAGIQERLAQQATEFFTSGPRIGLDPDAGLYRYSGMAEKWEHVATVHAMGNDRQFCEDLVAALKTQPQHIRPFTCRLLNK